MSEYCFNLLFDKPSRNAAKTIDRICKDEGGWGFNELNVKEGEHPWCNSGRYQGWCVGPNRGSPFDQDLADRVSSRIAKEVR